MGSNKPLLRTYSCHLGSLRSGGGAGGRDARLEGDFGTSLPWTSPESLLESVEALGDPLDIIESGRRLGSFRSLFRGLGDGLSNAGDIVEGGPKRKDHETWYIV